MYKVRALGQGFTSARPWTTVVFMCTAERRVLQRAALMKYNLCISGLFSLVDRGLICPQGASAQLFFDLKSMRSASSPIPDSTLHSARTPPHARRSLCGASGDPYLLL